MSPAVDEIAELYWWRKDGCLNPYEVPVPVRLAISQYAAGIAARELQMMKDITKK